MYICFFIAVLAYFTLTSALDARKTKRLINASITEKVRVKWYVEAIIWEWGAVLAVLIMCLLSDISFKDIGFRQISFEYDFWFNFIIIALCGLLFALLLYQVISYLASAKYREAIQAKFTNDMDKSHYNAVMENLLIPRSKKEKQAFFWVSLTAGICEEILLRGFLFFLLQAVFPNITIILVVIIASVLFGLWHSYQGLQGVIKTTLAGALFGCLYLVTGSLIPGILLHFFVDYSSAFLLSEE